MQTLSLLCKFVNAIFVLFVNYFIIAHAGFGCTCRAQRNALYNTLRLTFILFYHIQEVILGICSWLYQECEQVKKKPTWCWFF